MRQGLIVATIVAPIWALEGKRLGFNVLANACELFSWPSAGLVTTAKKIKERPDEIKRVIKAAIKGARYILQNREGYIQLDRKSTRLNSSHLGISYAVFCLKKKKN